MSLHPVVVAIVSPVFGSDVFSSLPPPPHPPPRRGRDDENLFVEGVTPLTRKAVQKNA